MSDENLDEQVHELKAAEAARINNQGQSSQRSYIKSQDLRPPPPEVVGFKVWVELEEEWNDDDHRTLDLPFASSSYFLVDDYADEAAAREAAEAFCLRIHESIGIDAG